MPDQPDWYKYRLESGRHALGDMGELAVRLGSVVSYDRSGTVIFADGMDYGIAPYLVQKDGGGASVDIVTSPTFQGGFSAKLTGGSNGEKNAGLLKRIQPITLSKTGLEVAFSLDTANWHFKITFQHNTGSIKYYYSVQIMGVNSWIYISIHPSTSKAVTTHGVIAGDKYVFHILKLVVDLVNNEYVKIALDQQEIDVSGEPAQQEGDNTEARIECLASVKTHTVTNSIAYIDNMIITTNEP